MSPRKSGAWTYDADRKLLTVGTQRLCVERELDWEASPRVPTIVYAGLNKAGRSPPAKTRYRRIRQPQTRHKDTRHKDR